MFQAIRSEIITLVNRIDGMISYYYCNLHNMCAELTFPANNVSYSNRT